MTPPGRTQPCACCRAYALEIEKIHRQVEEDILAQVRGDPLGTFMDRKRFMAHAAMLGRQLGGILRRMKNGQES